MMPALLITAAIALSIISLIIREVGLTLNYLHVAKSRLVQVVDVMAHDVNIELGTLFLVLTLALFLSPSRPSQKLTVPCQD